MLHQDQNNPSYLTVMRGVGVYQSVLMVWSRHEDDYIIGQTYKARKTEEMAMQDAENTARILKVEIR